MEQKFTDFSPKEAARLAQSPAAQQLMDLLRQRPDAQEAAASAKNGDLEQAKSSLSSIMADPQAKALLRQLWEEYHG